MKVLVSFFIICISSQIQCNQITRSVLPELLNNSLTLLKQSEKIPPGLVNALRKINVDYVDDNELVCTCCNICVKQLITFRKNGANTESMKQFMTSFCNALPDSNTLVCDGYVKNEAETIIFIIDNNLNLTSEKVCSIYFQSRGCQDKNAIEWSIPLPSPPSYKKVSFISNKSENEPIKPEESPLKVLQLTDFHYDPLYEPGSNADCGLPLCCQGPTPPANASLAAGYWGDYHFCDIPWHLISDFTKHVKSTHKNIDLIYYTGDIISHRSWDISKDNNTAAIKKLYKFFKQEFNNTPVLPILGNHESHPCDFLYTQWLFDTLAEEWSAWLPEDTKTTILRGGFYTVLIRPNFRIIALNSNVCFVYNLWLMYNDVDPYDQLKWLVQVLTKAEQDGEKVHILSHIPPGNEECLHQWTVQYRKIVNRFASIITAQFNGHTHLDELKLFYDNNDNKKVINVAYNGGSFTTFVGNNPNYRLYTVSNDYHVSDYDHYTFNLTQANLNPNKSPEWYKLYSLKSAYGMQSTNYDQFADLINRMKVDKNLLRQYYRLLSVTADLKRNFNVSLNRFQFRMSPLSLN